MAALRSRRRLLVLALGIVAVFLPVVAVQAERPPTPVSPAPAPAPVLGDVFSRFEVGAEGWTAPAPDGSVHAEDGALVVRDVTEDWLWIDAPPAYRGDWRRIAAVAFRLRAQADRAVRHPAILEIRGPGGTATHELHRSFFAPGEWRSVRVPVAAAFWEVDGEWAAILERVDSFRIRLDLHDETDAMEAHALDDVRLVPDRRSTFESGDEGWTAEGGRLSAASGGLEVTDISEGWCWVRAPARFRGDWTDLRRISFRVRADPRGEPVQPIRVQIESPAGMAIAILPLEAAAAGEWRTVSLPFEPQHWATSGDLAAILAEVADLWIRLDLTKASDGGEITGLDDVALDS